MWRLEVADLRGLFCRVPGCVTDGWMECDHLIPRSQQGPSVVQNGVFWCKHHHDEKTAHRLKIEPAWLDADQIAWLKAEEHAWWDDQGEVYGQHRRLFTRKDGTWD